MSGTASGGIVRTTPPKPLVSTVWSRSHDLQLPHPGEDVAPVQQITHSSPCHSTQGHTQLQLGPLASDADRLTRHLSLMGDELRNVAGPAALVYEAAHIFLCYP